MITKIISGGQTGADQAGLRAARRHGFKTGGYAPKNYMTEDGPALLVLKSYGLVAIDSLNYPVRTEMNVQKADAMLWFGRPYSPGGKCTINFCHKHTVIYYLIADKSDPENVNDWLWTELKEGIEDENDWTVKKEPDWTIMIAGNRESTNPGIGQFTESFLDKLFPMIKADKRWSEKKLEKYPLTTKS